MVCRLHPVLRQQRGRTLDTFSWGLLSLLVTISILENTYFKIEGKIQKKGILLPLHLKHILLKLEE